MTRKISFQTHNIALEYILLTYIPNIFSNRRTFLHRIKRNESFYKIMLQAKISSISAILCYDNATPSEWKDEANATITITHTFEQLS